MPLPLDGFERQTYINISVSLSFSFGFTQVLNPVTMEVKSRKHFSSLDNPGESELALDEHFRVLTWKG